MRGMAMLVALTPRLYRENLDQEDLVAWINVGMHHFPSAEVRQFIALGLYGLIIIILIGLAQHSYEHCNFKARPSCCCEFRSSSDDTSTASSSPLSTSMTTTPP